MDNKERSFIKYRPKIEYIPKILSVVDPSVIYEPTSLVSRTLGATPSGLLGNLLDLKDDIDVLTQRIDKCLEGYAQDGISFKDYASNLKDPNGNKELVAEFEKLNASSESGVIQAEVYPLMLDVAQECENIIRLINKEIYNNTANLDNLQSAEAKDKAHVDSTVEKEMTGELTPKDYNKLESRAIIVEIGMRGLQNSKNFMKEINELLYSNVNTYYNGHIVDIVSKFGEANSNTLEAIRDANRIEFKKSAMAVNNDMTRHHRLNRNGMRDGVTSMFLNVSKLRDYGSNDIASWIQGIDTDYDSNPLTQIVSDALDSIEFIRQEYTRTMAECFKQLKLDELVKTDLSSTMLQKKYARQKLKLVSDIITEKNNATFDAQAFVEKHKLSSKGTLCSR